MSEELLHIIASSKVLLPELVLITALILVIFFKLILNNKTQQQLASWLTSLITLAGLFLIIWYKAPINETIFNGLLLDDYTARYSDLFVLIAGVIVLIHIKIIKYNFDAEVYIILLGLVLGLLLLAKTQHFISFFVLLEMVSLCSYILVGMLRQSLQLEASIKYLLFGILSAGVFLYGISFVFGLSHSFDFQIITQYFAGQNTSIFHSVLLFLVLAGPLFKLSAFPFHIWAPDVYEAGPTPIISFLSVAPKIVALVLVYKTLQLGIADSKWVLSVLIMTSIVIGNLAALRQTNSKRMMGYSGIAQAGFMLIGLLALEENGLQSSLLYAGFYVFISTGTFFLLDIFERHTHAYTFSSLAGIGSKNLALGLVAVVFMMALVGLPPTSGFTAKFLVFSSLWASYQSSSDTILMVVLLLAVINTAVALFYYFKIPYQLFLGKASTDAKPIYANPLLWILGGLVIFLFFTPGIIYHFLGPNI